MVALTQDSSLCRPKIASPRPRREKATGLESNPFGQIVPRGPAERRSEPQLKEKQGPAAGRGRVGGTVG